MSDEVWWRGQRIPRVTGPLPKAVGPDQGRKDAMSDDSCDSPGEWETQYDEMCERIATLEAVARRLLEGWYVAEDQKWRRSGSFGGSVAPMSPSEVELIEALRGKG